MGVRALLALQDGTVAIGVLEDSDLHVGEMTVDVEYSTVNYKDGLALGGEIRWRIG
ncbi:MAG TPA: hypothetical protein VHX88_11200 [Solirubrobacteraceae bacterium]|jgi:hypothetical protein|nr:hypothetical protein [Solirubrobacteraceae bacterium]